ncbi:nucleoside diphosphate kinase [Abditibacterium utsteinense]|uniref:Nucleoside diphosphate kinase n=1 Tax=Abditibacterium utsteinense TaxID=1960156 RepID=A0A2S8SXJ9_9BACT|nr:nucleoside-diphosphate kinase [Abditibacterium utsteinense]PQV65516.1 nucleoside diphosphate kinase [Abditibacterium utsteinense]
MEKTLIVLKPDAVQRGLCGEILARFEKRGFQISALKSLTVSKELAEEHYSEHAEKPFFPGLVEFITGAPSVAMVLESQDAIALSRQMIGATNPLNAATGTIRGDLTNDKQFNLVHGSDSAEAATREIALWFPELS